MAPNKNDTVEVAIALDKQSAAEYARQVGASQSLMEGFAQSVERAGGAAYKAGDRITEAFANARKRGAELAAEAKAIPLEINKIADASQRLNEVQSKGGSSRPLGTESVQRIGSLVNNVLPDSEIGSIIQRAGDVGRIAKDLAGSIDIVGIATKAASSGFLEMATSLGPVAILVTAIAGAGLVLVSVLHRLDEQAKEAARGLEGILNTQEKYFEILQNGTTETAKKAIDDAEKQKKIDQKKLEDNAAILTSFFKQTGDDVMLAMSPIEAATTVLKGGFPPEITKSAEALVKFNQQVVDSDILIGRLTGDLKSGAFALNDAAASQKEYDDAMTAFNNSEVLAETANATKVLNEQLKEEADQKLALISIQKKYNDDVEAIEDRSLKARADLAQKFADAQISIAERAVEASQTALDKLQQRYQDLQTGLSRDIDKSVREANNKLLDDQIKAQRQERDDLEQHLQNLKQIRDRDAGRERDALLNRNYRDIFALRESKAQDISTEVGTFKKQQEKQQRALSEQQSDQDRAFDIARRERLIAYDQAQEDARAQYKQELDVINENKTKQLRATQLAYNKELNALINKTNDELRIKYNGYTAELALAAKSAAERLAIQQKTDNALLSQANNTLARVQANTQQVYTSSGSRNVTPGTPVLRQFAQGGFAQANVPIEVNEPGSTGSESFGSLRFPGHGIFTPFRSGNVNPGKSGGNVNNISLTINESNNPMRTKQAVFEVFKEVGFTR